MRILLAIATALVLAGMSTSIKAEGFSSIEAINRCDAFVGFAMRENLPASSKQPFKILCYFSLMDPGIHEAPGEVCARTARPYSSPTRDLAEFICNGTYDTYLSERNAAN